MCSIQNRMNCVSIKKLELLFILKISEQIHYESSWNEIYFEEELTYK